MRIHLKKQEKEEDIQSILYLGIMRLQKRLFLLFDN